MFKHAKSNKLLFYVFIAAGILVSCSKNNESPSDLIVGTWTVTDVSINETVNGKSLTDFYIDQGYSAAEASQISDSTINIAVQNNQGSILFRSDNTYSMNFTDANDSGPWTISDDGKQLTLKNQLGGLFTYDIKTLTASTLDITYSRTQNNDIDNNGTYETVSFSIELIMSKQ